MQRRSPGHQRGQEPRPRPLPRVSGHSQAFPQRPVFPRPFLTAAVSMALRGHTLATEVPYSLSAPLSPGRASGGLPLPGLSTETLPLPMELQAITFLKSTDLESLSSATKPVSERAEL